MKFDIEVSKFCLKVCFFKIVMLFRIIYYRFKFGYNEVLLNVI